MVLEKVLTDSYPAYVPIPRHLEEKAYVWPEYAGGGDEDLEDGDGNQFVAGKMFFVKFGSGSKDPTWPVDIFIPWQKHADVILGCLLSDAADGFPIPFYPRCLQRAHENAALVDFDFDILQEDIFEGLRIALGSQSSALDEFQLMDTDPAQQRY